jgi:hypothetical protein
VYLQLPTVEIFPRALYCGNGIGIWLANWFSFNVIQLILPRSFSLYLKWVLPRDTSFLVASLGEALPSSHCHLTRPMKQHWNFLLFRLMAFVTLSCFFTCHYILTKHLSSFTRNAYIWFTVFLSTITLSSRHFNSDLGDFLHDLHSNSLALTNRVML